MSTPDPDAVSALAETLRRMTEASHATKRRICVSCSRLYRPTDLASSVPVLCQACAARWEQRP